MNQAAWANRWLGAPLVVPFVAVQVIVVAVVLANASENRLHRAELVVAAPGVVGRPLVQYVDDLDGRPFDARQVDDAAVARDRVRRGEAVAALVVDLRGGTDVLLLDGAKPDRLRAALVRQVRDVEADHGRTVTVTTVAPSVPPDSIRLLVLVTCCSGFTLGLAAAFRPPMVGSHRRAIRGGLVLVGVAAIDAVLASSVAVPGTSLTDLTIAAVMGGCVLTMALLTRALHALAGWIGLAIGAVAHMALSVPLVLNVDAMLLAWPWSVALEGAPTWAALELFVAVGSYEGTGWLRPVLALAVWLGASVASLLLSRGHSQVSQPAVGRMQVDSWRLRTIAVVVPSMAVGLGAWAFFPEPRVVASPVAGLASETECISTGDIASVRDLNRISAKVRGDPSFAGGDVGAGTRLQDGRALMVFGDTLRGSAFDGQQFVRNSMLVFGPDCIQTVVPADHGALIPDRVGPGAERVGYWPMSIGTVERPGYDIVAVGAQRVRTTGIGAFDFENLGPALALFLVVRGHSPQLLQVRDLGPDDSDPRKPEWGAAAAVDRGWVYLYGTANPRADLIFGYSLQVARARPDDLLNLKAWQYWDGAGWQPDVDRAVELIGAPGGVSQTLSVFEQDGTWYALSKRDDFLGSQIVVWTAPHPWGPFDGGTAVAPLPSDAATGLLRYMPLAHPDLLPVPGTVVVSYSRNRTDVGAIIANPFEYRPRFMRVLLPDRNG